jgi:SPP1 gp7 family putative phage head morphogenesis protein
MPSKNSLNNLLAVEDNLHRVYLAKQKGGEEFHPDYKKNPEIFRLLLRSDLALEREMKKYFTGLTDRVHDYINLKAYHTDRLQASVLDWIIADWQPEKLLIKVILTKALAEAIKAGGLFTEEEINIDTGWSGTSNELASKFMQKYTVKLAGSLTSTTIDRVKESLKTSFGLGEDQNEATARLSKVIDDPRRAATIAHTEAVRAFTGGRLAVAAQVGADRKQWDATLNACPICQPLDGKVVKLDKLFAGDYYAPPAHPNCRCLIKILMPDEGVAKPAEDPFSVFKDFFDGL